MVNYEKYSIAYSIRTEQSKLESGVEELNSRCMWIIGWAEVIFMALELISHKMVLPLGFHSTLFWLSWHLSNSSPESLHRGSMSVRVIKKTDFSLINLKWKKDCGDMWLGQFSNDLIHVKSCTIRPKGQDFRKVIHHFSKSFGMNQII